MQVKAADQDAGHSQCTVNAETDGERADVFG